MDNSLTTTNKKSFWQRPEGKMGAFWLAIIVAGIGYGLFVMLPTIILLLQNTITALVLCGVLAALLLLAMDKRIHSLISYGYRGVMRSITKVFVEMNPINILKSYVEDLKAKRREMDVQLGSLKGELVKQENLIKKNNKSIAQEMGTADSARRAGLANGPEFTIATKQAARLAGMNKNLDASRADIEKLYRFLSKLYDNSGFMIKDIENEVQVREIEYESMRTAHKAWKSAAAIYNGDTDKKMLYDQAMDFLVDDYGAKVGEIERFMESSSTYLKGAELDDMSRQQEGMKMLDAWLNEPSSLLQGTEKQLLITKAENPLERLDLTSPVGSKKENEYAKLL